MSEPSLRNKTIKGVGWSAADAFNENKKIIFSIEYIILLYKHRIS